MLEVVICDDHTIQIDKMIEAVKKIIFIHDYDMEVALATTDPQEVIDYVQREDKIRLYILDIELNSSMDGIYLGDRIRSYDTRGMIIFVTNHSMLAPKMFEHNVEVMAVIEKTNIDRINSSIDEAYARYLKNNNRDQGVLKIISRGNTIKIILLARIVAIETEPLNEGVLIYLNDVSIIRYSKRIVELEADLGDDFERIHKGIMINTRYIKEIEINRCIFLMENNRRFKASRYYMKKYREKHSL